MNFDEIDDYEGLSPRDFEEPGHPDLFDDDDDDDDDDADLEEYADEYLLFDDDDDDDWS